MIKKTYIETTIPSFYYELRSEPEMIARREWTRRWWDIAINSNELVTSAAVIEELYKGNFPSREECIELIEQLPLLPVEKAITEIVQVYITHKLMPQNPIGDAFHLAMASHHRCDFLVTWNCRHLANANKFDHIRRMNAMMGLFVPTLVTPLELIGGYDE